MSGLRCTGCGSTETIEQIRAKHPDAIACCPERDMRLEHTPDCIVCCSKLPNIDARGNQPSGGLEFLTYGHYGSTEFDPMDGSRLVINICDPCLGMAIRRGDVLIFKDGVLTPFHQTARVG